MRGNWSLSQNTNVHPAFASNGKLEYNRNRVVSLFSLNASSNTRQVAPIDIAASPKVRNGEKTVKEVVQLKRTFSPFFNNHRETIITAPQEHVAWKSPYIVKQRKVSPIGPVDMRVQQSVLGRISGAINSLYTKGR